MRLVIQNGHVIDIESDLDQICNVVIEDGIITEITDEPRSGDQIIDATGNYVVPGFIDIHMHEQDLEEFYTGINIDELRQGVTSVVCGNCGTNHYDPLWYLDYIEKNGAPVNIGILAGHTYFRNQVGATDKYASVTPVQLKDLVERLQKAVDGGCLGVSYGIRYVPGINEQELIETARVCCKDDKLIAAHVRDDAAYIIKSMKEFIDAGKQLNLSVEVSHIGSMGGFGQMRECLELIRDYRNQGVDVHADCYPYYAFSTEIGETTYDEGFLERYQCDYSAIELSNGKYKGQRCTKEIFEKLRKNEPDTITVAYVMKEEDVDLAIKDEFIMLASDGLKDHGQGHPRASGSFVRLINQFVKKDKLTLKEALNKMTLMPAKKLKLKNKGRIQIGCDGDLVIFDFSKIADTATFENPSQEPKGIEYVVINGQIALVGKQLVNLHLGTIIK